MIVNVRHLWESEDRWEYSKQAELAVLRMCCVRHHLGDANSIVQSEGYCPEYDAIIDGDKYEVKFSSGKMLRIEIGREGNLGEFERSALSASSAKYYVCVSRGSSKDHITGKWKDVGKVRVYKRRDLVARVLQQIEDADNIKVYPASKYGVESYYIEFDPKKDHLPDCNWSDVEITMGDNGIEYHIPDNF